MHFCRSCLNSVCILAVACVVYVWRGLSTLSNCVRTHVHNTQGLRYTGYNLALKQQQELRDRLDVDDEGRVVFAEFIDVARDLFAFSLDEKMFEPGSLFSLALSPKDNIEPPIFSKRVSGSHYVTMVTTTDNHRESTEVCWSVPQVCMIPHQACSIV